METEKLKEQARKNAFRSNNGAVIRAVNIIRTDYVQRLPRKSERPR